MPLFDKNDLKMSIIDKYTEGGLNKENNVCYFRKVYKIKKIQE